MKPRADLLCGGSPRPVTLPFIFFVSLAVSGTMDDKTPSIICSVVDDENQDIPGLREPPKRSAFHLAAVQRISDEFRHHPECHSGQDSFVSNPSEAPLSLGNQHNVMRCDAVRRGTGVLCAAQPDFFFLFHAPTMPGP